MKGDTIPDSDNIARLCKPSTAPNGVIDATAFMLRENDESLSVNWLEFLNCPDKDSEIIEMQRIYSETFRAVSLNARIAILNVGEMCNVVRTETQDHRNIEVLHDPIPDGDQSHSEIHNLKQDNEFIAELILEVLRENHPARKK